MGTPSERHNKLGREFMHMAGTETANGAELMVVLESVMLGSMLLLCNLYGATPSKASALVEAALHHATKRFSEQRP